VQRLSALGGGLNRSPQHFILEEKMECADGSKISSRFHRGQESVIAGSLAAGGVAKSDSDRVKINNSERFWFAASWATVIDTDAQRHASLLSL
jgi:hypothetical protein